MTVGLWHPERDFSAGDAALFYADQGWHVFPLASGEKRPRPGFAWSALATTDPVTIASWWKVTPGAGVAVACGPSGLLVVDLDGDAAHELWASLLAAHGGPIATLEATTGRPGGRHLYFKRGSLNVGNSVGKLGPGIDTRGVGGYVVAPPSLHPSGVRYRWT